MRLLLSGVAVASVALAAAPAQRPVETLRAVFALPPHVVSQFESPLAFARATTGEYVVLDRRGHSLYAVDVTGQSARKIVEIGAETGRVLQPAALALSDDDIVAIYDTPNGFDRVQYFGVDGRYIGSFVLPMPPRQNLGSAEGAFGRSPALGFTGRTFLVNLPAWGSLFVELDVKGEVVRHVGELRRTGHESDVDLHLAFNTGIPVVNPQGGFYFVFRTGVPMFRKYDATGRLVFERHIEGIELDPLIASLPTVWPARPADRRPLVVPLIRAAAADRQGRLWVSLNQPYTYVYDAQGEKARTVQFRSTQLISATNLFFDRRGRVLVTPGGYEFDAR